MTTTPATPSSALRVLNKEDVDRICSGQSVVDLATCVKELVENALDAGATQIDVKLHEYGRDSIEVSDNGSGIASRDQETLALKHYTSKISAFEDIASVASFGFRGEALSSICQLASMFTVCTRTAEDELGTLLTYDRSGKIASQVRKARPVGTTVVVEDLFKPLPVRYKDFHRNIKKHYAKLLKVLQAYAVSCVRVKISVSNATGKNSTNRQVVLATQAHQSMGDNIASVFGTKFFRTMAKVEFDLNATWPQAEAAPQTRNQASQQSDSANDHDPETQDDQQMGDDASQLSQQSAALERQVVGFVSRVGEGVGRSDNDRQFFFINNRPFDLPKLSKAVNDVWRQFEMKQKPACVLNLLLPSGEFDVNVTPDKRETFLKHEAHLIESFKTQLTRMYEPSRGTFLVQPLLTAFARPSQRDTSTKVEKTTDAPVGQYGSDDVDEEEVIDSRRSSLSQPTSAPEARSQRYGGLTVTFESAPAQASSKDNGDVSFHSSCCGGHTGHNNLDESIDEDDISMAQASAESESLEPLPEKTSEPPSRYLSYLESIPSESDSTPKRLKTSGTSHDTTQSPADTVVVTRPNPPQATLQLDGLVGEWSFAEMKRQREAFFKQEADDELQRVSKKRQREPTPDTAHADALEPDNDLAAAALQKVLQKDDFRRMRVIGQFNLGFMIGKLENDDLFIIDQHASDEKFNYETLQQTTVLHQQPLVRPLPLELTAGEEMVIMDHLDVFTRHGFTFLVRKDAPPTKKLLLLSLPFSKQTQFGVEDIRELASLLMDTPLNPSQVRLPKLMAMFASRACRSSVMIGTALHKEEMQKIVRNLATLEQPWNCPHGRPTLRHLLDLNQLDDGSQA